ncbi:MAG TPA: hypothetical protein VL485_15295 [Ktedonobacteraceae bacterium]|jgi:hypothetical protein|nr:hypothetical protein [Ktedonobacteraceae bacterium]
MENGQNTRPVPKKKRGRPAGMRIPASLSLTKASARQGQQGQGVAVKPSPGPVPYRQESAVLTKQHKPPSTTREPSEFSQLLSTILRRDRSELLRVAQELAVSENSIYRWMSGNTEPRIHHLKRLLEVLPAYQGKLTEAINSTFHGILNLQALAMDDPIGEVPKDIYRRIVELITMADDDSTRLWEVSQALFEHALYHLDKERKGLAITYAHLLPQHEDGIHALREAAMRGHEPWPFTLESRAYLGSTSLAGMAATLRRMQIWNESENENRLQFEVDEHERSVCATPVVRGSRIAGALIVSSTNADFFRQPMACQAIGEYAQLLALALHERDFQPFSLLHLRPMPGLAWQRAELMQNYVQRTVTHTRRYQSSRQEAERAIEREMELEFEKVGQEQQHLPIEQSSSTFSAH